MLLLNLQNVEQLVFADTQVRALLPDLQTIFDQWLMAKRIPYLRSLRLRALMDFLAALHDEHVQVLESYFKTSVLLTRLDYHVVRNRTFSTEDVERGLNLLEDPFQQFAVCRDASTVYITEWK